MEDEINDAALKEALESGIDLRQYSAEVEQKLRQVSICTVVILMIEPHQVK